MNCSFCNTELVGSNVSNEHIIPNAIGGKKCTKKFICNDCNNKYGKTWEAELAESTKFFCNYIGIKRQRGETPPVKLKSDKEDLLLRNDGSMSIATPKFEVTNLEDDKVQIKGRVRTRDEAKKNFKKIKNKYALSISLEEMLEQINFSKEYTQEKLAITFYFKHEMAKSMTKSCLALLAENSLLNSNCEKSIRYLKGECLNAAPYFPIYETNLVKNRPSADIFHCVAVSGSSKVKKILGYVEYFNFIRIGVELDDNYNGDEFYYNYSVNPVIGQKIDIEVDFTKFKQEKIFNEDIFPAQFSETLNDAMKIMYKKNQELEIKRIVDEIFLQSSLNTEDDFNKLLIKISQNFATFVENQLIKKP